jgi:hypothetical protein
MRPKQIASELERDAHEAVYLIAALASFDEFIKRNQAVDHVLDESRNMIGPRLAKLLLGMAGALRSFVFEKGQQDIDDGDWRQATERTVGIFERQAPGGEWQETPLSLKEACNKILHHSSLSFPAESEFPTILSSEFNVSDCAQLDGNLSGRRWRAFLHIPTFAAAAYISPELVSDP